MPIPRLPVPSSVIVSGPYAYTPRRVFTDLRFAGNLNVRRIQHLDRELRSWSLELAALTEAERLALKAFFDANGVATKFLFKYLHDAAQTGVTLAAVTSGGSVTQWKLPDTGLNAGDFPDDASSTYTVRVGGSPVTVASVDTDGRKFVLQTGVSDASVVTADYLAFRYCLLSDVDAVRNLRGLSIWSTQLRIEEVGRDS